MPKVRAEVGTKPINLGGLFTLFLSDKPPTSVEFADLGNKNVQELDTGESAKVEPSETLEIKRAKGLITCASVCYLDRESGIGFVHHANVGSVSWDRFQEAMKAIENRQTRKVFVAYAHKGPSNSVTESNIGQLIQFGIRPENLVEITDLPYDNFGMNGYFQLGF
jgi:hypothetical protein